MLDAYIIESIREEQRKREIEREQARPRIHAPSPEGRDEDDRRDEEDDDHAGPIVIPLNPDHAEDDAA